jgi:hypothetical protein
VDYETFEFTEKITELHLHFFFNTVLPADAGMPGAGPYYMWAGPRPFDQFKVSERPERASQICVLVASPDHSVISNSGNCAVLPDVVTALPLETGPCLQGPSPDYPPAGSVRSGEPLLVLGISPDEGWWNVAQPENVDETCWLPLQSATISGDIGSLPLAEPPPLTGTPLSNLFVEITSIALDNQNRYVVDYETRGFTEQLPGTHIHFFFDSTPPEQVGLTGGGSRRMFGGPSPFTGYNAADRPADATQLCALVANPDHTVILQSGNCMQLPDAPSP